VQQTKEAVMDDHATLLRAGEILARREREREERVQQLFRTYARQRAKEPHSLGKPKVLHPEEALLLVALERNKYVVEAQQGDSRRWNGDAECRFHVRASVISLGAPSRLDLLRGLWASVSGQEGADQDGSTVTLTEAHLQGSVVQADLRRLNRELREQERQEREEAPPPADVLEK